jgi:diguanylate cyclase (GGDEF)-like protein/PAS domain S-box-containing protein
LDLWQSLPCPAFVLSRSGDVQKINVALEQLQTVVPDLKKMHATSTWPDWTNILDGTTRHALKAHLDGQQDFFLTFMLCGNAQSSYTFWFECQGNWNEQQGVFSCVLFEVSGLRRSEMQTRLEAEQFRLLANHVPVMIAYYEATHWRCIFANRLYAMRFGFDQQTIIGMTFDEIVGPETAKNIQPYLDKVISQGIAVTYERDLNVTNSKLHHVEVHLLPHTNENGLPVGSFVLITDVTKYRQAQTLAQDSMSRMVKFMEVADEGILFHQEGLVLDANPLICKLLGCTLEELQGQQILNFVVPAHANEVRRILQAGVETNYESTIVNRAGQQIPVEFIVRNTCNRGQLLHMVLVRDLSDRYAVQARIHRLMHHDPLTGLPNRTAFMEQLGQMISQTKAAEENGQTGSILVLLFIDLDHFKRVNDSLGYAAGDSLLRIFSHRITGCLRSTDVVARFGSDEFMVLLSGVSQKKEIKEIATKVIKAIEEPVVVQGRPLSVVPSVGIATFPEQATSAEELVQRADTAMYLAKARGRANYLFFDPEMTRNAYAALVLESDLSLALEREEFELFFQPQISTLNSSIVGAEALIRWNHPQRGLLMPDEFILVAEKQRLMLPMSQWVLRRAVQCAVRWHRQGLPVGPIAVNLSSIEFETKGFVEDVANLLRKEQALGEWIEFELTERMLMDNLSKAQLILAQLSALGILISVDDFGTGHSSLSHLKELPIDKMKIDRSFIKDLPGDQHAEAIIQAIVQMAHTLNLTVLAEGVETQAQMELLIRQGCHKFQGQWISKPLNVHEFENWVQAYQRSTLLPAFALPT